MTIHSPSKSNNFSPISLNKVNPEPITIDLDTTSTNESSTSSSTPFIPQQQFPKLRKIASYLVKIQKYTGYLFTTFLGLHLLSVVISPGLGISMGKSQDLFELGRAVYQQIPGMELLLVTGCSIAHIASGVGVRIIRSYIRNQNGVTNRSLLTNSASGIPVAGDDIGLGGVTSLIGLGYRKSIISTLIPDLSPLSFSGYILIPVLWYHFLKFRWAPLVHDGDSSLISLQFITQYLNFEEFLPRYQKWWNFLGLTFLVWVGLYHMVSGLWKIRRRFSARDKKLGYIIINGLTLLSVISLLRFKRMELDTGFLGKLFTKYLRYIMW